MTGRTLRVELPGLVLADGRVTQVPRDDVPRDAAYLSSGLRGPMRPFRSVASLVGDEHVNRVVRACNSAVFSGRLVVSPWLSDDGRWMAEFRDGVVDGTVMVATLDTESGELLRCGRTLVVLE